jgi:hypothetical protein
LRKFKFLYCLCITLLGCQSLAAQQSSFFTKFPVQVPGGMDIIEDSKGGLMVFTGGEMYRLDKNGKILSQGLCGVATHHYYFPNDDRVFEFNAANSLDLDIYNLKCEYLIGYPQTKFRDEMVSFRDMFYDNSREQFIACGFYGNKNMRYYAGWVAGIDSAGKQVWSKLLPLPTAADYEISKILPTQKRGEYVCLLTDVDNYKYNELYLIDSVGNVLKKAPLDPNPGANSWGIPYDLYRSTYVYSSVTPSFTNLTDSTYVISVIPAGKSQWDATYYIYDKELKLIKKVKGGGMNLTRISNDRLFGFLGNYIGIINSELQVIDSIIPFSNKDFDYFGINRVRESADGGFYGVASGYYASDPWKTWIIVFKTDKNGNIENKEGYSEWDQPLMLQPNPAKDEVRVAIPYYFGEVESWIYDAQGNEMLYYKHNELDPIDISSLAAGVYIVHARIVETGEVRKMKLVVEN